MFAYTISVAIVANLVFGDVLPVANKSSYEYDIILSLQVANLMNCCSFISNLVWAPVLSMLFLFQALN